MKLLYTCAKVLAIAALTAAAPQAVRSGEAISFPAQSQQPSVLTFEQAVGVMSPKNGGPVGTSATGSGDVSAQAGCRRNIFRKWGLLSAQEKSGFVGAIQCLMRTPPKGLWGGAMSRYDELVWVHSEMTPRVHGSDMFLPWHRYYLFAFRQLLKKECGYRGPFPWWKETNNAGNFGASDIFSSQYFGSLPPADGNGNGQCLSDGVSRSSPCPLRTRGYNITDKVRVDLGLRRQQGPHHRPVRCPRRNQGGDEFSQFRQRGPLPGPARCDVLAASRLCRGHQPRSAA